MTIFDTHFPDFYISQTFLFCYKHKCKECYKQSLKQDLVTRWNLGPGREKCCVERETEKGNKAKQNKLKSIKRWLHPQQLILPHTDCCQEIQMTVWKDKHAKESSNLQMKAEQVLDIKDGMEKLK